MGAETGIGLTMKTKIMLEELLTYKESADSGLNRILVDYKKVKGIK